MQRVSKFINSLDNVDSVFFDRKHHVRQEMLILYSSIHAAICRPYSCHVSGHPRAGISQETHPHLYNQPAMKPRHIGKANTRLVQGQRIKQVWQKNIKKYIVHTLCHVVHIQIVSQGEELHLVARFSPAGRPSVRLSPRNSPVQLQGLPWPNCKLNTTSCCNCDTLHCMLNESDLETLSPKLIDKKQKTNCLEEIITCVHDFQPQ